MKTNHLNYYYMDFATIWCELNQQIVEANDKFFKLNCDGCPFFNGHLQGDGIECLYEDPLTDRHTVAVRDPYEYEEHRNREKSKKDKNRGA